MPVDAKCPYIAEWSTFSEDGRVINKQLGPEDILPFMVQGMTFSEIANRLNAPLNVVMHAVAVISDMMKWRTVVKGDYEVNDNEMDLLRDIQQEYVPGVVDGELVKELSKND